MIIAGIALLACPSVAAWVIGYGYGGLTALIVLLNLVCVFIALVSPRMGLFVLALQAMYSDQLKRMAVYYGAESMMTVMQVLIGPMLTLCAINLAFVMDTLVFKKIKVDKMGWFLFFVPIVIGLVLLLRIESGLASRAQFAANVSLYMSIIPMGYVYFKGYKDWRNFIGIQILLCIPSALWGVKQYYMGFNQMEWEYALSGLSPVHSRQMMQPDPRIFGLFGSASAFGGLGLYAAYAFYMAIMKKGNVVFYAAAGAILFYAIVLSEQRTALLMVFIVPAAFIMFVSKWRTWALYGVIGASFLLIVLNAEYLTYVGLEEGTVALQRAAGGNAWAESVFRLTTFSARTSGLMKLTNPENWSLLGKKTSALGQDAFQDDQTHDIFTGILINSGVVGLLACLIGGLVFVVNVHKVTWDARTSEQRLDSAWLIASLMPTILISLIGGSNYSAVPFNLQVWTLGAGIFMLRREIKEDAVKYRKVANENELVVSMGRRFALPSR